MYTSISDGPVWMVSFALKLLQAGLATIATNHLLAHAQPSAHANLY